MPEKYIIVCKSTTDMLRAERILREERIATQLIPVPSIYGSVCSTGIRIHGEDKNRSEMLLQANHIGLDGIHPLKNHRMEKLWQTIERGRLREGFARVLERVGQGENLTREEIEILLATEVPEETEALYSAADRMRRELIGDAVDIRGAIEFSNYCRKNCFYCGLQEKNRCLFRYRMEKEEIIEKAIEMKDLGMKTVILQSGEDDWYSTEKMVGILSGIKCSTGMRITLSIGERTYDEYRIFREAGADNYLLKIETTNPLLFKAIHPDDNYQIRLQHMNWLKELGYVVGSGNIIGLPNQKVTDLAGDIIYLNENGINMLGLGPFLPADHTEFARQRPGTAEMTYKVIAVARLVCKNVYIPSTTALGSLFPGAQARGLQVGANTLMINMTPEKYSSHYQIYSGKENLSYRQAVEMVHAIGRKVPEYLKTLG